MTLVLGLPVVRFANGLEITVWPHTWEKTKADGEVVLTRTQLPLALAWALTIHKCQVGRLLKLAHAQRSIPSSSTSSSSACAFE